MEQEHRITYKAGITRTPSDFLCQDGELAECINLATDNEELKPIVQPAEYITSAVDNQATPQAISLPTIIYIHKFNTSERYIGYTSSNSMIYGIKDGTVFKQKGSLANTYSTNTKITSIGKTLIIADSNGIHYYLWKPEGYKDLGTKIPEPKVEFSLRGDHRYLEPNQYQAWAMVDWGVSDATYGFVSTTAMTQGIIADRNQTSAAIADNDEYNNLIAGMYAKNKRSIARKKGFCNPFFARWALELVDGSYTYISQPFLLMPSVTKNSFCYYDFEYERMSMFTYFKHLAYRIVSDNELVNSQIVRLEEFSDIVKSIVVFVSDEIDVYDLSGDQKLKQYDTTDQDTTTIYDSIFNVLLDTEETYHADTFHVINTQHTSPWTFAGPNQKQKDEIISGLESTSVFYKIADIGLKQGLLSLIDSKIETHTLENLTTLDILQEDDYYSRNRLYPSFMYAYNSRLNIANVARGFYEGYGQFLAYGRNRNSSSNKKRYTFFVCISTDEGDKWLMHQEDTFLKQGCYFYYPDSRAKRVVIYKTETQNDPPTFGTCILNKELKEHSGLNGAYYLKGLPGIDFTDDPTSAEDENPSPTTLYNNSAKETLSNYIITSEVNNPWVFKAGGYNMVGTGEIVGMTTTTQALSQAQFGPFPLLVFSESGIWAMSVDKTGLYEDMQPIGRDVCINPSSIIQTDGAVFFVSKKGLMVAERAGNGLGVRIGCVSEQMNGRTFNTSTLSPLATGTDWAGIVSACQTNRSFLDYIRDSACFMAYDYIDSRILIVNPSFGFAFTYNIADGTISKVIMPAAMTNAVNNYPDYLLQGSVTVNGTAVQKIYSFYGKPREEEVQTRSLAFLLTRPMKLAGPVSQSSLRQLMNVGTWDKGTSQTPLSCVKTEVYVSSDMLTWYNDISRFGAAARYYRLALYMKLLPTERLSGTILTDQERRSHNIR